MARAAYTWSQNTQGTPPRLTASGHPDENSFDHEALVRHHGRTHTVRSRESSVTEVIAQLRQAHALLTQARQATLQADAAIAELRRNGIKISPEKVVHVGRHQDGYLVWLAEGRIDTSGKAHILRPNRRKFFEREAVPAARVVDLIFAGIERGRLIGHMVDKEVYEVDFDGTPRRQIAIFISPNGYIVTALPVT
ncbi:MULTISPECIES: hypothetical protein [Actinoalloteichus]|uniref:Uncharacterized protein n=1 Tax=Actinoalloteichus fjordicus TaxID=1612552 RepID=A0AAC9LDU3_9PSEU|nr:MULTISPECIES: hypothetical protein [Actinoalloteichus]APU15039.1 hypothetical protein UA74_14915 [Actinoalloteichus fjordicus]APU21107.1 hypothetical protein UA75_15485 [Actinoalloteichus sp. GBA129-24]